MSLSDIVHPVLGLLDPKTGRKFRLQINQTSYNPAVVQ
jgi:hypothetical protein